MQTKPKCYGAAADDRIHLCSRDDVVDRSQASEPEGRFYTNFDR